MGGWGGDVGEEEPKFNSNFSDSRFQALSDNSIFSQLSTEKIYIG